MKSTIAVAVLFLTLPPISVLAGKPRTKSIEVTYTTDLAGAMLYEGERAWGMTPVLLKYELPEGCTNVRPLTVRWPSGAEASIAALTVCTKMGKHQQFAFNRPVGYPGREVDAQFALQLAQMSLQQQQADSAYLLSLRRTLRIPTPTLPIHCTSQVVGNQLFTNCF